MLKSCKCGNKPVYKSGGIAMGRLKKSLNRILDIDKILNITQCNRKDCKYRLCNCCKKCVNNKTLGVKDYYSQCGKPKIERVKYNEN